MACPLNFCAGRVTFSTGSAVLCSSLRASLSSPTAYFNLLLVCG